MNFPILLLSSALLLSAGQDAPKQATQDKDADAERAVIQTQLPSYPLTKCMISGEPLEEGAVDLVVEGRLVRTCCKRCVRPIQADPAKYIAKIDAAVIKAQLASYPMKTCPVSGEELGSMGDPIDVVHGTRLVRFCCKSCPKKLKKDPAKVMAEVNKAYIAAQRPTYAAKVCLISNNPLEEDAIDHLYGTQLVRFCCPRCVKPFEKDPQKYLAKLHEAGEGKEHGGKEHDGKKHDHDKKKEHGDG